MFFDSAQEIRDIAQQTGCAIFVIPKETDVFINGAIELTLKNKSVIEIEQVRDIPETLAIKKTEDLFIVVRPADKLSADAANALLKSLEEPKDKVHFVLITDEPSRLLPTILSRSAIYFLRGSADSFEKVDADAKIITQAKKLFTAKPADLVSLAEEITKKKDGVRAYTLLILSVAIEILYKSYYKTKKEAFLLKIPKFLKAYEAIERNGHIKLHLVADLM